MIVSEDALLRSGFSSADLRKVKNNLESYGGSLGMPFRICPDASQ